MTDAALVAAARAGDRDAAGTLVRRYYADCWRFAYRMLGHRQDAEDAVQETFLRVARALHTYHERDRFRSWLLRILANVCRTTLLQRRRRLRLLARHAVSAERYAGGAEPAIEHRSRERAISAALQAALLELDPKQREAFLLKYGEGMEYAEMAKVTGAGVSALKMRVKRACEALRPMLHEDIHEF